MKELDIDSFVAAYVEYAQTPPESPRSEELFWSFNVFADAAYGDPELCWKLILAVLDRDSSQSVIGLIAAGPMEELLSYHGPKIIGRVEKTAEQDPVFRKMLGGKWRNEIAQDIWDRLVAARGPAW